jgi:hypothetical protein
MANNIYPKETAYGEVYQEICRLNPEGYCQESIPINFSCPS